MSLNILFCVDAVNYTNTGSHVVEKIQFLENNQKLVEGIAQKGRHLAAEILHADNIAK